MADFYFVDTSALSKRCILETGSTWLCSLLDPTTGNNVVIVRTTAVEMIAAISRRERGGTILPHDAAVARSNFRADLVNQYQVVELRVALAEQAMLLVVGGKTGVTRLRCDTTCGCAGSKHDAYVL